MNRKTFQRNNLRVWSWISRKINKYLWTGRDRPICAEAYSVYMCTALYGSTEARWRRRVDLLDKLTSAGHCRRSYVRWLNKGDY